MTLIAGALLACALLAAADIDELPDLQLSGFTVQLANYPPPHEAQVKLLLQGDHAEPLGGGLILAVNARLNAFSTNGVLEMQAITPRCIFDAVQRTVSSTGLLQIHTGDGASSVQGEGFLLGTNSTLIFSNRMQTVIRNFRGKPSKP